MFSVGSAIFLGGRAAPPDPPCFFPVRRAVAKELQRPRFLYTFGGFIPGGRVAPPDPPCVCFGTAGGRKRSQAATLAAYFWWIYTRGACFRTIFGRSGP